MTARKILAQCHNNIVEIVGRLDHLEEGIVNTSDLKHALEGQKINDVGADELDALLKGCDRGQKGYISTNKFIDTLYSMGAETESEVILRRLSKTLSHSGADLQQAMRRYDTQGTGRIDKTAFKKCLKALSVAMTDPEIQKLTQDPGQAGGAREPGRKGVQEEEKQQYGAPSTLPTYVDIEKFARQVNEAGRIKPLPNYVLQGPKGSRSAGATRPGGGGGNSAPTANDDSASVSSGVEFDIDIVGNDTDPDDDLDDDSVTITQYPAHGTLEVQGNGKVRYMTVMTGQGQDSFLYTVADDNGNVSNEATVSISIN